MKAILSLGVLAAFATISSAANLVQNGDFEADAYTAGGYNTLTSGLTGWTIIKPNVAGIGVGYLGAPTQEMDLSGTVDDMSGLGIYQDLATTAGQAYSLSLDVYTAGNSGGVDVQLDSNPLLATNLQGSSRTNYAMSFVATGSTTRLSLLSNHGNISHVDNVSVQAVPEPASMAALGLGAVGLLRRRRNAR